MRFIPKMYVIDTPNITIFAYNSGKYNILIKFDGHHIPGSPYEAIAAGNEVREERVSELQVGVRRIVQYRLKPFSSIPYYLYYVRIERTFFGC